MITLTNPITRQELDGTKEVISQVEIGDFHVFKEGTVACDVKNVADGKIVGTISFKTPAAVNNIKGQIETYVIAQNIIRGTKS